VARGCYLSQRWKTYSLTWDFARVTAARAERRELLEAAEKLASLRKQNRAISNSPEIVAGTLALPALAHGSLVYLPLKAKGGAGDKTWCWGQEQPAACDTEALSPVPGLTLESSGLLHGYPLAHGAYTFSIQVQDDHGRYDRVRCRMLVDSSQTG
jgi:hypothetical protein